MKYIIVFLVSGLFVSTLTFIADKGNITLAGILVFAPVVSITSYLALGRAVGSQELSQIVFASWYGLPPLLVFMVLMTFLSRSLHYSIAVGTSFLGWAVAMAIINQFKKIFQ